MLSRSAFRGWQQRIVSAVCTLHKLVLDSLLDSLACVVPESAWELRESVVCSKQIHTLLEHLRASSLLPCLCFHRSQDYLERLLIGLAEICATSAPKELTEEQRHALLESRRKELERHLAHAEKLARKRLAKQEFRKAAAKASKARRFEHMLENEDEREKKEDAEEEAEEEEEAGEKTAKEKEVEDEREEKEEKEEEDEEEEEVKGQEGEGSVTSHKLERKVAWDPEVVRLRETLKGLAANLEDFDPDLQRDFSEMKPTYSHEVECLIAFVQRRLDEVLAASRGPVRSGVFAAALRRGIAMHLPGPGAEEINWAVQMLFRLGHVRVLLAGETLGRGMNLPCRSVVVLDSSLRGNALQQVAGRGGRRGLDLEGYTIFVQDLHTIQAMHGEGRSDSVMPPLS